jgi:hypothetical protein
MISNENDAIQAGAPAPTSSREPEPAIKIADASALDQFVTGAKTYERWGILAGVAIQMVVLFALIVMGGWKALTGGF